MEDCHDDDSGDDNAETEDDSTKDDGVPTREDSKENGVDNKKLQFPKNLNTFFTYDIDRQDVLGDILINKR